MTDGLVLQRALGRDNLCGSGDLTDGFPNRSAYWTLNIVLAALFWISLLRLSWTERRQRPR
jgi:hypothetical protein